jgi:microcystin degradation protein MlrC
MDRIRTGLTAFAVGICMASFAAAAQADPAGKWRVEFGSHAGNDGTITLRIAPEGGAPVDVETKITAKSGAGKVANAVRDSLKVSLGDGYHVETDDGEDVVIKLEGKTPKFEVALASSTLTGLEVKIKKE